MKGLHPSAVRALTWVSSSRRRIADGVAAVWRRLRGMGGRVTQRHHRLMDTDPRYPVTLASGGTALARVLVANPAIAHAIATVIAAVLGVPGDPPHQRSAPSAWPGVRSWPSPLRPYSGSIGDDAQPRWDDDWDDRD